MNLKTIGRLHVITDEALQRRFSHEELAAAAGAGGADVVQFRDKRRLPASRRLSAARGVVAAAGAARCVINDDVEIARLVGAWGVHLGVEDASPEQARLRWPALHCIGATANDLARARRMVAQRVDYLGVGPVFATTSKQRPAPVLGLAGLSAISSAVDCPVIAIGGIDEHNVSSVLAAGAWGVAVLSAIALDDDPRLATERLRERIEASTFRGLAV